MTPVKQYPITDLTLVSQSSSKSLVLTFSTLAAPLTFQCSSSSEATAVLAKLESSKGAAGEALETSQAEETVSEEEPELEPTPARGVRFVEAPAAASGETASMLYEFEAQGEDELSVAENEAVTVLDRENDEWWLVRNSAGHEGVVPAQYVQIGEGAAAPEEDPEEEESRREEEAAAAAAALEVERRREREKKAEQRRAIESAAREKARQEDEDRQYALKLEEKEAAKAQRRAARRDEETRREREEESERR